MKKVIITLGREFGSGGREIGMKISADHRIFAPPRSFSQLVTSFFGAMYQGILRMLFVA